MLRYIHGSKDSIDLDVVYVFDELPSDQECARFCAEDPAENRNIIVVRDGQIAACYKGFPDENNNALLATYPLHEQEAPLLITHRVPRDIFLKALAVTRKVLMMIRRTQEKAAARAALKGTWQSKMDLLSAFRLQDARWEACDPVEEKKRIAFQLGQILGLLRGEELYTKAEIGDAFPDLVPYLYRTSTSDNALQEALDAFTGYLQTLTVGDIGRGLIEYRSEEGLRQFDLRGKETEIREESKWN